MLPAITAAIFFGGWHPVLFEQTLKETVGEGSVWWAAICAGAFLTKVLLLCWLQLVIRWTLPRFRFDQIQKLCWKILLPVTLANVFLTAALILLDPSLELLAIVGLLEIAVIVVVTAAASRKQEPAAKPAAHAVAAPAGH